MVGNLLQGNAKWLEKMQVLNNIILTIYIILETVIMTFVAKNGVSLFETALCFTAVLVICITVINFLLLDKKEKINWLKTNTLIWIYFAIRFITFVYTGMQYTMARSVLFELLYLIAISSLLVNSSFIEKYVLKAFVIFNLITNIVSIFVSRYCWRSYFLGDHTKDALYDFFVNYTYANVNLNSAGYNNPNAMGMITGIAILIALTFVSKDMSKFKKFLMAIYFAFSLYCIWKSYGRAAWVGMLAAVCAFAAVKLFKKATPRRIVIACLVVSVISMVGTFAFISTTDEAKPFTSIENNIDELSSKRYSIWKDCYYSHKEEVLLGCGNITLEKLDRAEYKQSIGKYEGDEISIKKMKSYLGPHNGYVGTFYTTGIFASIIFFIYLIKRFRTSEALKEDSLYYLAIIYILVVNLFECMIPISTNICSLYFFLILALKEKQRGETK